MGQKITLILGVIVGFSAVSLNAQAEQLPTQCKKLFNETEQLIKEAEQQPGTHTQFASIKNKLSQSKKQILALDRDVQIKSCDKGLTALNNLKNKDISNN
ncbi:DUF5339 domain-containing protein [Spirabiliibacterium falconis]|uniref:DUF5339 domain-containing protein n=1 Tax=Spirabiliibacterium falconis TaxID=572023 RepID=UPI001AADAC7E|nr:DUF5339 domain-containing protein [Spirabiliibacterium falconis]MBE2893868.1 DUF5339 domain-containing protein [Spirabiliibacterium falconis]